MTIKQAAARVWVLLAWPVAIVASTRTYNTVVGVVCTPHCGYPWLAFPWWAQPLASLVLLGLLATVPNPPRRQFLFIGSAIVACLAMGKVGFMLSPVEIGLLVTTGGGVGVGIIAYRWLETDSDRAAAERARKAGSLDVDRYDPDDHF